MLAWPLSCAAGDDPTSGSTTLEMSESRVYSQGEITRLEWAARDQILVFAMKRFVLVCVFLLAGSSSGVAQQEEAKQLAVKAQELAKSKDLDGAITLMK